MTTDERLKRVVDTLGDRLRDEIARELRLVTDELSAEAETEREAAIQAAVAAVAAVPAPPPPSEPEPTGDPLGDLIDAVRALDDARSLTDVLDTLVERASRKAVRSGLLLVRRGRARKWRDDTVDLALEETGIVADVIRTGFAASRVVADAPPPPFAEAASGAEVLALPLAMSGEVLAVLYAENADAASLEILTRHAGRVLEVMTAFKTARAMAGSGSPQASSAADGPALNEDEEAARRYARLLISEIRLYHQDAVEAGQRERDLSSRLGGEIARARVLYDQRVPPHLRSASAADYFQDELVRTLAGGDASLLPGVAAS